MSTGNIVGYVIYKRDIPVSGTNGLPPVLKPGVFTSLESAELKLIRFSEEYCINKVGLENFVSGQISKPELSKKITEGFVLEKVSYSLEKRDNDSHEVDVIERFEIKISKRTASTWYSSASNVEMCYFGTHALVQNESSSVTVPPSAPDVPSTIEHLRFSNEHVKVATSQDTGKPETKKTHPKDDLPKNIRDSQDKITEELKTVIEKRREKLTQKEAERKKNSQQPGAREAMIVKFDVDANDELLTGHRLLINHELQEKTLDQ